VQPHKIAGSPACGCEETGMLVDIPGKKQYLLEGNGKNYHRHYMNRINIGEYNPATLTHVAQQNKLRYQ
jgi:hypothetical protein